MPTKRTLNIPDHLVKTYDTLPNKSEFLKIQLESMPVLDSLTDKALSKLSTQTIFDLQKALQGMPFVPKLANIETIKNILDNEKHANSINQLNQLDAFSIFFIIKNLTNSIIA